jgi:G protein-coupled receptor GPR1
MSYSDRFAQHPIFAVALFSSFCQCFMGFADVAVFSWRERPWRHIPGSDGSFLGSFAFWRNLRAESSDTPADWSRRESKAPRHLPGPVGTGNDVTGTGSETPTLSSSQAGLLASLRRWSMSRKNSTFSTAGSTLTAATTGGGARRPPASKRVYTGGRQTKEAEMAHERLKLEREDYERRNRTSLDGAVSPGKMPGARREWFDLNVSEDSLELGAGGVGVGRNGSGSGTGSGTGWRS